MNLIVKHTPYGFENFILDHPISTILALIALILLLYIVKELITVLKKCKKASINLNHEFDKMLDKCDLRDEDDLIFYERYRGLYLRKEEKIIKYEHLKITQKILHEFRIKATYTIFLSTLLFSPLISTTILEYNNNFSYINNVSLLEIKDRIKIENDRLTIDSLPNNYYYKNKQLTPHKLHDFKIIKENFYRDMPVKLIDSTENEYIISKSELDELTRK